MRTAGKYCAIALALMLSMKGLSQQRTYCNPINIDYGYTPIPNFATEGKHRATADPVIVTYKDKGDYYLFSTNQMGYWWRSDMNHLRLKYSIGSLKTIRAYLKSRFF